MLTGKSKTQVQALAQSLGLASDASLEDIQTAVEANVSAFNEMTEAMTEAGFTAETPTEALSNLINAHDDLSNANSGLTSQVEELTNAKAGGVARSFKKNPGDNNGGAKTNVFECSDWNDDAGVEAFNLNPVEEK